MITVYVYHVCFVLFDICNNLDKNMVFKDLCYEPRHLKKILRASYKETFKSAWAALAASYSLETLVLYSEKKKLK